MIIHINIGSNEKGFNSITYNLINSVISFKHCFTNCTIDDDCTGDYQCIQGKCEGKEIKGYCGDGICGEEEAVEVCPECDPIEGSMSCPTICHPKCPEDCSLISAECIEEGETFDSSKDPNAKCCNGLQEKSKYDLRTCTALPSSKYTCIRCGDGECGLGENKCNCPKDCEEQQEKDKNNTDCIENSGGLNNYYVRGTVNPCPCDEEICPACGIFIDECLDENTLLEYSCDNLNGVQINCENGCSDGACIK